MRQRGAAMLAGATLIAALVTTPAVHAQSPAASPAVSAAASPALGTPQTEQLPAIPTDVPTPADVSAGTPVEQAAAVADLLNGDRTGWLPAILTAYRLSGYSIVDAASQPVGMPPIDPSTAMVDALQPHPTVGFWELWLLANVQHGAAISMTDWAGMMTSGYEATLTEAGLADGTTMDPADMAAAALDDIANGAASSVPERAFFSAFIAGRAATMGADPSLPGVSPDDVWLDPVSFELLTREFGMDLVLDALPDALAYEAAHASTTSHSATADLATIASAAVVAGPGDPTETPPSGQAGPTLDQAAGDSFFQACVPSSKFEAQGQGILKGLIKTIFKGQSVMSSELTKNFTDAKLKLPGVIDVIAANHPGTVADPAAAEALKGRYDVFNKVAMPIAGAVLEVTKIIAYQLGITVVGELQPDPIKRTYDGGQKGVITVHISFDPSGEEVLYCMDFLLQALGLSISLPPKGELDAPTQLTLVTGLEHLDQDRSPAWFHAVKPDGGVVTGGISGKQGNQMTVDPNKPEPFTFKVRADLALKDSNIGKDFSDAWSTVASGATGGAIKGIANYVERMKIFGGRVLPFDGVDFGPKGTWRGTITVTYSQAESHSTVESGKGYSTTRTVSSRTDISDTYTLHGNDPELTPGTPFESEDVALTGRQSTTGGMSTNDLTSTIARTAEKDPMKAADTKRIIGCDWTEFEQDRAEGAWGFASDATASVIVRYDGSYTISIRPAAHVVTVPDEETHRYAPTRGMDCYGALSSSNSSYLTPPSAAWDYHGDDVQGTVDLRKDTISGSRTTEQPDGSVVTVTWDLHHVGPIMPPSN